MQIRKIEKKVWGWEMEEEWGEAALLSCAQHARYVVMQRRKEWGKLSDKIKR